MQDFPVTHERRYNNMLYLDLNTVLRTGEVVILYFISKKKQGDDEGEVSQNRAKVNNADRR